MPGETSLIRRQEIADEKLNDIAPGECHGSTKQAEDKTVDRWDELGCCPRASAVEKYMTVVLVLGDANS